MRGFSLVELSIVLVILGLLTGGILAGQNLIRAAELRAVTTEFNQYQTAVQTFRDKYFALPGDMRNAEDFWGTMSSGTCPNATGGSGTQTCNGNGNGIIEESGAASQSNERFAFWKHLANAGLIEGSYTGIASVDGPADHVRGENAPASRLSSAGWAARYWEPRVSDSRLFAGEYEHVLWVGAESSGNNGFNDAVFTPTEQWNLDTKMDDGLPAQGRLVVRDRRNGCTTTADGATELTSSATHAATLDAAYHFDSDEVACAALWRRLY